MASSTNDPAIIMSSTPFSIQLSTSAAAWEIVADLTHRMNHSSFVTAVFVLFLVIVGVRGWWRSHVRKYTSLPQTAAFGTNLDPVRSYGENVISSNRLLFPFGVRQDSGYNAVIDPFQSDLSVCGIERTDEIRSVERNKPYLPRSHVLVYDRRNTADSECDPYSQSCA